MEKELHILILEDLPSDAELAQNELRSVLKNYMVKVVDTEKGFVQALATFKPDLIISDYQLPSFDGLSALKITQDKSPFTPFVILTGSMNEDTAVECIKAGADDYVIKEHIKRLGPAVLNAMENKKVELERKQAEEELKDSEEHLKILFDYAPDAYYISDLKGNFIDGNKAAERVIGYKKEELIGKNFLKLKLLSLTDIPTAAKLLAKNLRRLPTGPNEFVLNRKDNSKVTVEISTYPVKIKGRTFVLGIARDITERKRVEEALKESEAKYRAVLEQSADNIFLVDLETKKILESNISLRNLLGYSADEMKKLIIYDFVARPKDEIKKKLGQLQKEEKTVIRERKYLRKDGSLVDVEMVRNLIIFGNKKVLCVVSRDISERKRAEERLKKTMDATIETVSKIIEVKDPYTSGHQQRVSQLATAIAKELNLSPDKIEGIRIASLIHDIGKIGVPTEILSKTTTLSDIEFSLIKEHSQIGYDILKPIDFSYPVAQIVLQHHEKIDGSGYPNKLKGDEILLEAKIICVADVVEAMSSHRPYRPALGIDAALEEISQNKGILYDPEVVDTCIRLFKEKDFEFKL